MIEAQSLNCNVKMDYTFFVPDNSGSTFYWEVTGGDIISGNGTHLIDVRWNATSSFINVFVVEMNAFGCSGDTVSLSIEPEIGQGYPSPVHITECFGEEVVLRHIPNGEDNFESLLWGGIDSSESFSFTVTVDTSIFAVVEYEFCPNDTIWYNIEVGRPPYVEIVAEMDTVMIGQRIKAESFIKEPYYQYSWFVEDKLNGHIDNIEVQFHDEGRKRLKLLIETEGCRDSAIYEFFVLEEFALHVPNAFTPNGDGTNDKWVFNGVGIKTFKCWLFNRWGDQVYYWDDELSNGWDGRYQNNPPIMGTYVYKIQVEDMRGRMHERLGHFFLIQ